MKRGEYGQRHRGGAAGLGFGGGIRAGQRPLADGGQPRLEDIHSQPPSATAPETCSGVKPRAVAQGGTRAKPRVSAIRCRRLTLSLGDGERRSAPFLPDEGRSPLFSRIWCISRFQPRFFGETKGFLQKMGHLFWFGARFQR